MAHTCWLKTWTGSLGPPPLVALNQLQEIVSRGVVVVTLTDQRVYREDTLAEDFSSLLISMVSMHRANEESKLKSERLSAAWQAKRENAANHPLTSRCPAWLELDPEKLTFRVIEAKAKVVRRSFDMTCDGMGKASIAKSLNMEGEKPIGRSKRGWYASYVDKLL